MPDYRFEFKTKAEINAEQVSRLREMVKYVMKYSPFYKKALLKNKIKYTDIKTLKDIQNLPITSKHNLQKYNKNFFCTAISKAQEIVSTTGTTGDPVYIILTENDLKRLAINEARSFYAAGVRSNDLFHIAVTLDSLFMAGMAYYLGITKIGATVYRAGMHNIKRQLHLFKHLLPTGIVSVPSFLLKLIEGMEEEKINPKSLGIKKALVVGDSIRDANFKLNAMGNLINKKWPIELYSTYGNTEGAISFCECKHHIGGHEHSDMIISEILNEYGIPVEDGQLGQLVLTTLGVTGMPLLRYQTGDITFKLDSRCKCGRNSPRIGPIIGRDSQMLKIKGVKVYPKTIEQAILKNKEVVNYVIEALTGQDFSDKIIVKIGTRIKSKKLKEDLEISIQAYAKVKPTIELRSVEEVEYLITEGGTRRKPKHFIDNRKTV